MACLGAIRPSEKGNSLHELNSINCEKILTIKRIRCIRFYIFKNINIR